MNSLDINLIKNITKFLMIPDIINLSNTNKYLVDSFPTEKDFFNLNKYIGLNIMENSVCFSNINIDKTNYRCRMKAKNDSCFCELCQNLLS